jgi:hypothetical protein
MKEIQSRVRERERERERDREIEREREREREREKERRLQNNYCPSFSPVTLCLLSRKSNLNPGTRYHARGLNEKGGVGNEIECELLMFHEDPEKVLF